MTIRPWSYNNNNPLKVTFTRHCLLSQSYIFETSLLPLGRVVFYVQRILFARESQILKEPKIKHKNDIVQDGSD
jgi:hypothetical protein